MPFRLGEGRAKLQVTTSARMPHDIYQACKATGCVSNTRYVQEAVNERLARDLGIPIEELMAALPPPRGPSATIFNPETHAMARGRAPLTGPANTIEEVK